jgi:ankyrin repeat protein
MTGSAWDAWSDCDFGPVQVGRALAAGAEPNARNESGFFPLIFAAQQQKLASVQLLLSSGADVKAAATDGRTALHVAAGKGAASIVSALLAAGADPNAIARGGWTPLMVAARANATESVSHLLKAGADVNAVDDAGWTALISASVGGDLKCVRALLGADAKVDARNQSGDSALGVALDLEHAEVVRLLRERGAVPSATERLLEAILAADVEHARAAIADGADLASFPFLWKAIEKGDVSLFELLLSAGIPFDEEDSDGDRPIVFAARNGQTKMVQALVEAGAKLEGEALQAAAATADWSDLVKLLATDWSQRAAN